MSERRSPLIFSNSRSWRKTNRFLFNEIKCASRILSRYRGARLTRTLRVRVRLTVRVKNTPHITDMRNVGHSLINAVCMTARYYKTAKPQMVELQILRIMPHTRRTQCFTQSDVKVLSSATALPSALSEMTRMIRNGTPFLHAVCAMEAPSISAQYP